MKLELLIALRYLREKRKQAMVSAISLLSVAGIAAGVMALVIALALSTGFKEDVQGKILGATPAVNLMRADGAPIDEPDALLARLAGGDARVTGSAPAILKQVILSSAHANQGAALKGVHPGKEAEVSDFFSRVTAGDPHALDAPAARRRPAHPSDAATGATGEVAPRDTAAEGVGGWEDGEGEPPPPDGVLIGKEMARTLGVAVGDTVKILNPMGRLTPLGMTISEKTVRVAGVFESGLWDIDANWAYVNIETARRVFAIPEGSVMLLQFDIDDLDGAPEVAAALRGKAGPDYHTTTWIELNGPLFSALKLEKIALFITIGLIVFVASLNIVTTLIMMVLEKQGDIAIFAAMGATAKTMRRVFMWQGLILGVVGTAVGGALGVAVSWVFDHYRLIRIEAEIYSIPYVPFHVRAGDVLMVSATAILISYLATLYPSRGAARLNPVEVLRYE
ncbi:MAG: ABC transporter permease [Acidobacteriota bacterium]|jgi:lipoprotein-releasing system permease protein|nr:ABC transporter permease [Acidobacteriota bacterium]